MAPKMYDPNSENEQAPPLPSAPLITLSPNILIQPPLTRRGSGPGLILFPPHPSQLKLTDSRPLDPEPVQKWAEEGFAVVVVTPSSSSDLEHGYIKSLLHEAINELLRLPALDTKDKFAIIVYGDNPILLNILDQLEGMPIACLISYGTAPEIVPTGSRHPAVFHLANLSKTSGISDNIIVYTYSAQSQYFVLPQTSDYEPGNAALAHSRSLVFLRVWLGGPSFDLEAIWEEHCAFEFETRSVAKTMATMVQEPYVNHVPTMTGGIGRQALTAFYRDHFIFSNPDDAELKVISRTVGADRIVDEFIYHTTHDRTIDWLMPGVPPTGKKLSIPMMAVVNIRGDRLYNEHIWWDQGTALRQAGVLPTHVPYSGLDGSSATLRLPVAGPECAQMLLDGAGNKSNEMMGTHWGIQG